MKPQLEIFRVSTFILALSMLALLPSNDVAQAATTTISLYHLGENDPGAATGGAGSNPTIDAVGPNDLAKTGSPTYTNDTIAAGSTLAMDFDGAGAGRYDINSVVSGADNNFGIEMLVRADGGFGGYSALAYNGNSANSGWGLYREGNNYVGLYGGKFVIGSSIVPAVPRAWTHLALVRDSGVTTFYAEGIPVFTSGDPLFFPNTPAGAFNVGGRPDGGENFNGAIDNVRVFTFAPSTFNAATDLNIGHKNLAGYRLGEIDPGAANGGAGNATTNDLFGGHTLTKNGTGQTYTDATAGGGTTLGMDFSGSPGSSYSAPVFSTITDNFRLEAWAASDDTANNAVVAYNGRTGGGNPGEGGYGIFRVGDQWSVLYGNVLLQPFATVQPGVLTHLVLERENGVSRFFVNGVQAGSDFFQAPLTPVGQFMIGGNPLAPLETSESFNGRIDEVRLVQIPEPASAVLFSIGVVVVGRVSRRRRARQQG